MGEGRLLIVGGGGYFGSRLAAELGKEAEITITARRASPPRDAWLGKARIAQIRFDSASGPALRAEGSFSAVINLAVPSAAAAARDPEGARRNALAAAQACVRLLEEGRAERLLHFSTFHVYGSPGRERYDETDLPAPVHPYAKIHFACEQLLSADERVFVVRPTNLVGAPAHADLGEQSELLFLDLCRQAATGAMRLRNDGLSYRDFLPFGDAFAAVRALLAEKSREVRLWNLAAGVSLRLDDVAKLIQSAAPGAPSLEFGDGQDAYRRPFTVGIARLARIGWLPRASLRDEAARVGAFFAGAA